MRLFSRIFFRGLLAFLPVFLTVYGMIVFITWLNQVCSAAMAWLFPRAPDLPGLGIAVAVVLIVALGTLVRTRLVRWLYDLLEIPLKTVPMVRELYTALKQLTVLFATDERKAHGKVVSLKHPNCEARLVGMLTRDNLEGLDGSALPHDWVAVYLPFSYQIGGYTVFVPASWVTEMEMPVEAAMRNALTGWVKT